jgi:outer membrane lipoprotein-sorting protein
MLRQMILPNILLLSSLPLFLGADVSTAPAKLTAAQIVEKNVEARGGLAAWRAVETMSMSGKMEAGGTQNIELPFVLEMKRPRKARFELKFKGQTAVQVYDGLNGWKLRPFLNRHQVEPFTAEEMKKASQQQDLDGPLIDYAVKGTKIELEGIEPVDGRGAYKLKLTLKNGEVRRVWVDTKTFLDVEIDGTRRLDGRPHSMATYMRDYRSVQGLMVPYLLETSVEGVKQTEKTRIESVTVNPKLEDSRFAKPE